MTKLFLLVKGNIRKTKGQTLILALLFLVSSMMLNTGLTVMLGFGSFFDGMAEELGTSDVFMSIPNSQYTDEVDAFFRNHKDITAFSANSAVIALATLKWKSEDFNINMTFCDIDEPRTLSQWKIISEPNSDISDTPDSVYVPYLYRVVGGYEIGDKLTLTVNGISFDFTVSGFTENIYQDRMSAIGDVVFVPRERFAEISRTLPACGKTLVFADGIESYLTIESQLLEITGGTSSGDFGGDISSVILGDDFASVKNMRTSMSSMMSVMMIIFTAVIVAVCLLVIRFRINNSIEEDMPKIGSLQSVGYTNLQITASIMAQYGVIALAACLIGIIPAYLVMPFVGRVFAQQSGLFWESGAQPVINTAAVLLLTLVVVSASFIAAFKVRKISPVLALRGGITTHSFKRNYIPLEKTRLPLTLALSLKSMLLGIKQSATIFVILTAISFTGVIAVVLYYNAAVDLTSFEKVPGIERSNAAVIFVPEEKAVVKRWEDEISARDGVWKAQYLDMTSAKVDGTDAGVVVMNDYSAKETVNVYQGVFPLYDNEIAIAGLLADNLGKKIGDEVLVSVSGGAGEEIPYLITGLTQGMEAGSLTVYLTLDGMMKSNPDFTQSSYTIYLEKGVSAADFISELESDFEGRFVTVLNVDLSFEEGVSAFSSIIATVGLAIMGIAGFVVLLVLYFVISSTIIRRRRELGIQKALGYTTANLMNQIIICFTLPLTLGTVAGCALGAVGINPLMSVGMSQMGIMKADYIISIPWVIATGICIVLASYLVSLLITWRIRKISAFALVTE